MEVFEALRDSGALKFDNYMNIYFLNLSAKYDNILFGRRYSTSRTNYHLVQN